MIVAKQDMTVNGKKITKGGEVKDVPPLEIKLLMERGIVEEVKPKIKKGE